MMQDLKYIIYGTGDDGRAVYDFLESKNILCAIDGNPEKKGKLFFDKTITSLPESNEYLTAGDTWIIVSSDKYESEMVGLLRENHIKRYITRREIGNYFVEKGCTLKDERDINEVLLALESITKKRNELFQDLDSEVEFYLVDAFEISHYLPFYKELLKRGIRTKIVAEHPLINTAGSWFDYENAVSKLKELKITFSDIANPSAKVAFTTQYSENLVHYKIAKKVQLSYGIFLMKKTAFPYFDGVAEAFDYLFVHGEYQKKLFSNLGIKTETIDIAYPRYQKKNESKENVRKKYGIQTNKPILLYLPTWDQYGSIADVSKDIAGLRDEFFLIAKPHHCTMHLREKEYDKELLYECFDLVLEEFDLADAARISDVAVCDAKSGAVSEIAFLNNDIRLLLVYKNCGVGDFWYDFSLFAMGMNTDDNIQERIHDIYPVDKYLDYRRKELVYFFSKDIEKGISRGVEKILEIITIPSR